MRRTVAQLAAMLIATKALLLSPVTTRQTRAQALRTGSTWRMRLMGLRIEMVESEGEIDRINVVQETASRNKAGDQG